MENIKVVMHGEDITHLVEGVGYTPAVDGINCIKLANKVYTIQPNDIRLHLIDGDVVETNSQICTVTIYS